MPRWKGFNLADYFSPQHGGSFRSASIEDDFSWMQDRGFNFVRIPMAYPNYLNFDRSRHLTPEEVCQVDEEVIMKLLDLIRRN